MAGIPEEPKPTKNEEDCSQLMGNESYKNVSVSSASSSQQPEQCNPDGKSHDSPLETIQTATSSAEHSSPVSVLTATSSGEHLPSLSVLTTASSGEHSFPVIETLSPLDIDIIIGSCDLKSEEITSLMAEKVPSSDSEDSYGSFTKLKLQNKERPHFSEEEDENLASDLSGSVNLDEGTMQSWLADGSDDSAMSSCREPLIPLDNESDMEEFSENNETAKTDEKVNDNKDEPIVDDLISLEGSEEKILESALNETCISSKSLLDIENEPVPNQIAVPIKNLLDIKIETTPKQTAITNQNLLDIEIQATLNQTAVANESLLDIEIGTSQNRTAVANESLLDIEVETSQNSADLENKSLLDVEVEETSRNENQDSNIAAKKCARVCIDHIKDVLNDALKEVKKPVPKPTAKNYYAGYGNGLKTLEEELKKEAEADSEKRKVYWEAEMGLPKINAPDTQRIVKDESFKKNIKKLGICSNKLETSSNDLGDDNELERKDKLFQACKAYEKTLETFQEEEYIDVVTVQEESPLDDVEEHILHNVAAAEVETKYFVETNIIKKPLSECHITEKTAEDAASEKPAEKKVETDDDVKEQKAAAIKSILKKHVTFSQSRGNPGMEHMALHHEDSKIEERQQDIEIPLRFMTETYPSHEDEELLSESLNATLEPGALSRPRIESPRSRQRSRRESPRAAELYEELKILEKDEQPTSQPTSPCQSPQRSEIPGSTIKENKTITRKSGSKFSKFFKSVKKKIWS